MYNCGERSKHLSSHLNIDFVCVYHMYVCMYICHGPAFSVTPIKSIFTCEDGGELICYSYSFSCIC